MLPFGGFPLREGALDSEESGEKSHSGVPGSTAACAYPGRFVACRALRQLSSRAILQTAWHVGPWWCPLAFGENLSYVCASLLLVHGVILNRAFWAVQFTLHSAFQRMWSCIFWIAYRMLASYLRSVRR